MKNGLSWMRCVLQGMQRLGVFLACGVWGGLSAWALPDGVTAVDYIESTGAQRIDTNYTGALRMRRHASCRFSCMWPMAAATTIRSMPRRCTAK